MNSKLKTMPRPGADDRILLLTHTDMDGSGPVTVLSPAFPDMTVEHCSNASMDGAIRHFTLSPDTGYDFIIMTDISCSEETAAMINNSSAKNRIALLDHHQTAETLNRYGWALVQDTLDPDTQINRNITEPPRTLPLKHSSGTSLALDYLAADEKTAPVISDGMRTFAYAVTAWDSWDWTNVLGKDRTFEDLNTLFTEYGQTAFEKRYRERIASDRNFRLFDDTDLFCLDNANRKADEYVKHAAKGFRTGNILIGGKYYSAAVTCEDQYPAKLFERMETDFPDTDLYVQYYGTGFSLRSRNPDVNAGEIAAKLGGGGHPGAAGFKVPKERIDGIISESFNGTWYPDDSASTRPVHRKGLDISNIRDGKNSEKEYGNG